MFLLYSIYRSEHPEAFHHAAAELDTLVGTVNTIVLLFSSFTVASAIHYIQKGDQRKLMINLVLTLICAGIFMVIKYFEYTAKFDHGIFPGAHLDGHGEYAIYNVPYAAQFFSIYFVMTGIHGVHVLVGMGLFAWLLTRAARGHFTAEWYTPIELTGLYWHIVDIIWIFLFPLMYLI